jgi:hypothetical protein
LQYRGSLLGPPLILAPCRDPSPLFDGRVYAWNRRSEVGSQVGPAYTLESHPRVPPWPSSQELDPVVYFQPCAAQQLTCLVGGACAQGVSKHVTAASILHNMSPEEQPSRQLFNMCKNQMIGGRFTTFWLFRIRPRCESNASPFPSSPTPRPGPLPRHPHITVTPPSTMSGEVRFGDNTSPPRLISHNSPVSLSSPLAPALRRAGTLGPAHLLAYHDSQVRQGWEQAIRYISGS